MQARASGRFAIGLDFGTESVRAVVVDTGSGETRGTAVHRYDHGVIDTRLPGAGTALGAEWALQHPGDWIDGLERAVRQALRESGVDPGAISGIGIDFTASTVLPTDAAGTPLCRLEEFAANPHAWPKLWKHHAAQPEADRVNDAASGGAQPWLQRYGGRISSEWLLPKAWQVVNEAPDVYDAAAHFIEAADWVAWQLTGVCARNACGAGFKGLWHKRDGYPSPAFLRTLDPRLGVLYDEQAQGQVVPPGQWLGNLTTEWAGRLGLPAETPVATPTIDAHAAVLGSGIARPGPLFLIMGTSTCHLTMAEREVLVPGIAGVVEDGIAPGYYGYEAGQSAVGDIFAWFVTQGVPQSYAEEAKAGSRSLHDLLSERAARLAPGASGLLALDWWNGNRSTLMDAELSGLLVGMTLSTKPEHIYRALVEATAFGTRVIVDAFAGNGLAVSGLVAGGGLTQNSHVMQIYADVCGRDVTIAGSPQASALGAAMLGALAAGRDRGGHDTLADAVDAMTPPPARTYRPNEAHRATYDELYACYRELYDLFGRERGIMKTLKRLRDAAVRPGAPSQAGSRTTAMVHEVSERSSSSG